MNTNLEKIENNLFKLSIEIDADTASQEYNRCCKKFGESVNVPGFRKGKAPRHLIEKHVGTDKIKGRALDNILPSILASAISENELDLVTEPVIDSYEFELGQPLKVTAKLETKPEVKLANYKGQVIEVPEYKADETVMEKQLESIQNRFATMEVVTDRATEETDVAFIDFFGKVDGEPIKGGEGKNHQLDLNNSHFIPGFAEQIVGKKIGEEFTIKVTFPEEYGEKDLAGKEAEFEIKINEIKAKKLPEMNDELAQKVGPFQTVEDLKADIQKYVEQSKETENKQRAEKALIEKVVEEAKLDVPDSMVNREARHLMDEMEQRMKGQGISMEQIIEQQGQENIWNELREDAAKRVKSSLVLGAIAKEEKITLEESDFSAKVKEIAASYNTDEKAIYDQMAKSPAIAQSLSQQIMSQKIVNYLLENNEVKYIEDTSNKK